MRTIPLLAFGGSLALALSGPVAAAPFSATLAVVPDHDTGPACPFVFKFDGTITADHEGRVQYKWVRSDGGVAPPQWVVIPSPGASVPVSTTWTLGAPGMNYAGWEQIKILTAPGGHSPKARFRLRCERAGAPGTPGDQ